MKSKIEKLNNKVVNSERENKQLEQKGKRERLASAKLQAEIEGTKKEIRSLKNKIEDKNAELDKIYHNKYGDEYPIFEEKLKKMEKQLSEKDEQLNELTAKDFFNQTVIQ